MKRAFVLGAGLGTRLKPLTDQLPKPLIPVHHRPLLTHAFAHLRAAGAREFVVNTHHLPEAYPAAFPDGTWEGCPVAFRHEPVLLETGGGLANVADLFQDGPFFVYNGDILTDVPLEPAIEEHQRRGNLVTLLLRKDGPAQNVTFDEAEGRVLDLRGALGSAHPDRRQFTGLYIVDPAFFHYLCPRGEIESVVPAFLRAIADGGRVGGVAADEGLWLDLGDRESYLDACRLAKDSAFPAHAPWSADETAGIHPSAQVAADAAVDAYSSVGADAVIGAGAVLVETIVWAGGRVAAGARLRRCIVRSGQTAVGELDSRDI